MRRAWLLPFALLLSSCRAGGDKPGFTFLPDMLRSVPYDTYDRNGVTKSGQTLQLPPEGTVPREGAAFPYGPGPEEARRAGAELRNPIVPSPAALRRGQQVYDTVCAVCHGAQGAGDGPIIGRFPNPPALTAEHAKQLPDGRIYHIITRGQALMPSHAAQVLPRDRWHVILYLRQLQGKAAS